MVSTRCGCVPWLRRHDPDDEALLETPAPAGCRPPAHRAARRRAAPTMRDLGRAGGDQSGAEASEPARRPAWRAFPATSRRRRHPSRRERHAADGSVDGLRRAPRDIDDALEPESLVPADADRRFKVAKNDHATVVPAPFLAQGQAALAPGIRLTIWSGTPDVIAELDRGELDPVRSPAPPHRERISKVARLADDCVAVALRPYPSAGRRPDAALFAAVPHLPVWSRSDDTGVVHRALRDAGCRGAWQRRRCSRRSARSSRSRM